MSPYFIASRTHKVVTVSLILVLALLVLVFVAATQTGALAQPAAMVRTSTSVVTQTYVIFASGPSGNNLSAHLAGSNSSGEFQILGGGIYAGDGGYISNVFVNGAPPPPIDVVGGCYGFCSFSGNAVVNYNATPLPTPVLYDIADFMPGGVYAIAAGANYYFFAGSQTFAGNMAPGLYYVDGDVILQNVGGYGNFQNISVVATGEIKITGGIYATTYDSRFPVLFSLSSNTSSGAIGGLNSDLDFTGDIYAPNGSINLSGTMGRLHGRVYGKEVNLSGLQWTITCPDCLFAPLTLSLQKSVTPTAEIPYHGVVTYTSILRNHDLVSDTTALFTDTLPTGVTFGQWIEQPVGVVENGDSITWTDTISATSAITFTFTATHTGTYGDVVTNTAYFSNTVYLGSASATFGVTNPLSLRTYVIAATGPSGNSRSVELTGSSGGGAAFQILGGGIYAGDGGYISNVFVNGAPPPPIDFVGGCTGICYFSGNAVANYNAAPADIPILYDITDFMPGGVYAIAAGANYHSFAGSQTFTGNVSPGLYYINGDVALRDVGGPGTLANVSIVATGDIRISGAAYLTTYDARFPVLFSLSNNISNGAIGGHNPELDLTGNVYVPNGAINVAGAIGPMRGRIYGKEIHLNASRLIITCPDCLFAPLTLSLQKSVTPTVNVPYHGVVTYTSILRNHDLVSDTAAIFTDTLPTGVTFGQWIEQPVGVVQNGDSITWTGTISATSAITFTFTATHTGTYGDVVTNTAYFTNAVYLGSADATFSVIPIYTLTIGFAGNGAGTVISNPIGSNYLAGTVITLTAIPSTTSHFGGWSGDVITTANPVTLTLDANRSVTATFTLNTFVITPTAGTNGSITPSTPQTVNYGDDITFTITADIGYHIVDAGVDGISHGPIGLYTFTYITADHTITATFAINTYTLTVNYAGTGSGVVMLDPPGPSYTAGTIVTLTAVPSMTSRFFGWSGNVITTTNPLMLTMDSDKTLTAAFVTYRVFLPIVVR